VLDGAVAATKTHGLERAAVEAPGGPTPDVHSDTPHHRHPQLERVPAHLCGPLLPAVSSDA
jgi:hypothetical protein